MAADGLISFKIRLDEKDMTIKAKSSAVLEKVLTQVAAKRGLDVKSLEATLDGEKLDPKLTLEACGIAEGATVEVLKRADGGGGAC